MPVGQIRAASGAASLTVYSVPSDETGNAVLFAQRYDVDGSTLGAPIQLTSPDVSSSLQSTIALSDGKFVVVYNYGEFDDTFPFSSQLAFTEIGTDGTVIGGVTLGPTDDLTSFQDFVPTVLAGGTFSYILQSTIFQADYASITRTLGFVDASGHVRETVVSTDYVSGNAGPFAQYHQTEPTIQAFADGGFSVSYTGTYYGNDPDFPPAEPVPSGTQRFNNVYDRDGHLLVKAFVDFDGTRTLDRYDPESGAKTSATVLNLDGSRLDTQFGITGRAYVEQSIARDASGFVTEQTRYYGDAQRTLAFDQTFARDGTSEVHNYDTSGREIVRQVGNLSGEHDVTQFTFAGTGITPLTTTLTHFGTSNTRQFTDIAYADGTHVQQSLATGVTLTSHQGVADTFIGFARGADTFAFRPAFGHDVVKGFASGNGSNHDTLQFDDRLLSSTADLAGHLHQTGADTLISFDDGSSVRLVNVAAASLTSDNVQIVHHDVLLT